MPNAKKRQQRKPQRPRPTGWLTSDADEIERQRLRGLNETYRIEAQANGDRFYNAYRVDSATGQSYRVEIRSLSAPLNSCNRPDHQVKGLGTCQHIEATLYPSPTDKSAPTETPQPLAARSSRSS